MTLWLARFRQKAFGRYLIVTNVVGCGALMGLGDIVAQRIECSYSRKSQTQGSTSVNNDFKQGSFDWARFGRMVTIGTVMGPFNHVWYTWLDKVFPGQSFKIVLKKILADQIVAAPFFTFSFFIGMGTLEGRKMDENVNEFKTKFWTVYRTDWMVWPAAQAINFVFVPPHLRVLYVAVVTLGWDTFLSSMKHVYGIQELVSQAELEGCTDKNTALQ